MKILCRAAVITFKAAKLCVLLALIKCFGSPGAACLLANLAAIRGRVALPLRDAARAIRLLFRSALSLLRSAAASFFGVAMHRQNSQLRITPDSLSRLLPSTCRPDLAAPYDEGAAGPPRRGGDAPDPDLARWEEEGGTVSSE